MISYGFSVQGKSHIDKGGVCQDANIVKKLDCGLHFAAVADGVGSAAKSDVGSKLAVGFLYEYCNRKILAGTAIEDVEDILSEGYSYTLTQIKEYSQNNNIAIDAFDTTMSAVIYDGCSLAYGHAGDGGIVAKYLDGSIQAVTARQKGVDGISVRPLRAGDSSWEFGSVSKIASVLLLTDGMLDGLIQPSLINLPKNRMELAKGQNRRDKIYITAAEFFMNADSVYLNKTIKNANHFMNFFVSGVFQKSDEEAFLQCVFNAYTKLLGKQNAQNILDEVGRIVFAVGAMQDITDDKTVACLINEHAEVVPQEIIYYTEPDWKAQADLYKELLYGKKVSVKPSESVIDMPPEENNKGPQQASNILKNIKQIQANTLKSEESDVNKFPLQEKKQYFLTNKSMKKTPKRTRLYVCAGACAVLTFVMGIFIGKTLFVPGKSYTTKPVNNSRNVVKQIPTNNVKMDGKSIVKDESMHSSASSGKLQNKDNSKFSNNEDVEKLADELADILSCRKSDISDININKIVKKVEKCTRPKEKTKEEWHHTVYQIIRNLFRKDADVSSDNQIDNINPNNQIDKISKNTRDNKQTQRNSKVQKRVCDYIVSLFNRNLDRNSIESLSDEINNSLQEKLQEARKIEKQEKDKSKLSQNDIERINSNLSYINKQLGSINVNS